MNNTRKSWVLILALVFTILIPNSSVVKLVNAQPTPAIPEFSLKYVDNIYFSTSVSTIDPYTGQTQNYQNKVVEKGIIIEIKGQPFTQPIDSKTGYMDTNDKPSLFYIIHWKGHYSSYWQNSSGIYPDSNADIEIRIGLKGNNDYRYSSPIRLEDIPEGGQVDFQVQAFLGYYIYVPVEPRTLMNISTPVFVGQSSGWSSTQTLTLTNASTTTPIATTNIIQSASQGLDTIPLTTFTAVVLILVVVICILLVLLLRRRRVFSS
jgi:hypothetical protein